MRPSFGKLTRRRNRSGTIADSSQALRLEPVQKRVKVNDNGKEQASQNRVEANFCLMVLGQNNWLVTLKRLR